MLGLLILALLLIGRFYPGSGADVLDWKPTRSPEVEAQNEVDDIAQMLEAQNARRRRRGLPERTADDVEADVWRERRELEQRRAAYQAEQGSAEEGVGEEIEQVLAAKNARRRRNGLPELTLEEYRATLPKQD